MKFLEGGGVSCKLATADRILVVIDSVTMRILEFLNIFYHCGIPARQNHT